MKQNLYEPCQFHANEFLQMVCQQCEQACLACPMCIDQFHSGHGMISLKKFITSEIPKLYTVKPDLNKLNKKIQSMRQGFMNGFEQMRKRIGKQINSIEQVYNIEADRLIRQMEVVCGQGTYNLENIAAIKHKIQSKLKIPDQVNLNKQFQTILHQVNTLLTETTESICENINSLKEYWKISCELILDSKKKCQHYFSQNKHESIELCMLNENQSPQISGKKEPNQLVAVNTLFDGKYHIAVVEPPLNPFKNQVRFKIQESTNNCVWIGVCDLEKVKQKGFENCYKKGEGCYWIWQSGGQEQCQFFSSLLQESVSLVFYSSNQQTSIQVGDTIQVKLDYLSGQMNKISFFKIEKEKLQDKSLIYQGQIQKKRFHACIALGDELQKVSIVI